MARNPSTAATPIVYMEFLVFLAVVVVGIVIVLVFVSPGGDDDFWGRPHN